LKVSEVKKWIVIIETIIKKRTTGVSPGLPLEKMGKADGDVKAVVVLAVG